ncbi:MAG: ATP synthase subunit I [Colwellia sp.]
MNNKLTKVGRKFAFSQILFTLFIVLISTLITYLIWGVAHAKSSFAGGIIVIIPNMFFALKAFRYAGAQSSKKVVDSFFSGVKFKMAIMAILLALTFKFVAVLPIPFFMMFSGALWLPLVTPYLFKHQ